MRLDRQACVRGRPTGALRWSKPHLRPDSSSHPPDCSPVAAQPPGSGAGGLGDAGPEPGLSDAPASQVCCWGHATGGPAGKGRQHCSRGRAEGGGAPRPAPPLPSPSSTAKAAKLSPGPWLPCPTRVLRESLVPKAEGLQSGKAGRPRAGGASSSALKCSGAQRSLPTLLMTVDCWPGLCSEGNPCLM